MPQGILHRHLEPWLKDNFFVTRARAAKSRGVGRNRPFVDGRGNWKRPLAKVAAKSKAALQLLRESPFQTELRFRSDADTIAIGQERAV